MADEIGTENEKGYELRALCSKDIFVFASIVNKIGFKEFKNCIDASKVKALTDKTADVESIGIGVFIDIAGVVISHLPACEEDIYTFLSGLSGIEKKALSEIPLGTFAQMIVDVFKMDGFKDFIKVVSQFIK